MIYYHEDDHNELYNLDSDPGEQHDVLTDNRETAAVLCRRIDSWLTEVDAEFPAPDLQYDPDWQPNANWWGSQITVD